IGQKVLQHVVPLEHPEPTGVIRILSRALQPRVAVDLEIPKVMVSVDDPLHLHFGLLGPEAGPVAGPGFVHRYAPFLHCSRSSNISSDSSSSSTSRTRLSSMGRCGRRSRVPDRTPLFCSTNF